MNTRTQDLNILEEGRDRRGYESKHARKTLDRVYQQSKNPEIERLRKLLIDAQKQGDYKKAEEISWELKRHERV